MHFSYFFFLRPIYLHKIPALLFKSTSSFHQFWLMTSVGRNFPWESTGVKSGQRAGSQRSDFLHLLTRRVFPDSFRSMTFFARSELFFSLSVLNFFRAKISVVRFLLQRREPERKMWTCEKISCFRAEWKKSKMGQNRKEGRAQIWGLIPKLMRRWKENVRLGILTKKKLQTADGTVLGSGWISRGNSQRKLFFQHFLRRCNDFLARPCSLDRKNTKIRNWWANWENERELFLLAVCKNASTTPISLFLCNFFMTFRHLIEAFLHACL